MTRTLPSMTAAAALLAGALFLSATGGAVAGSMITGKQIKDGSLTTKDVKDRSLKTDDLSAATVAALHGQAGAAGAPGLSGVQYLDAFKEGIAVNASGVFVLSCPAGKTLLSATGQWEQTTEAVQIAIGPTHDKAIAFYKNTSAYTDQLDLQVVCATVTP